MNQNLLNEDQIKEFNDEGFIVLKDFYDIDKEIKPILFGIWQILGILIKKYNVPIEQKLFSVETFDFGFQELISIDRGYGGELYDAIKQIPSFTRLCSFEKNENIFSQIRGTDLAGIAAAGSGIRIDNPKEEKFRSVWHYEYRDQLRSIDGIVFWSPLVPILLESGPVQICPRSHKGGLRRSFLNDPEKSDRTGVYSMRLENEQNLLKKYEIIEPLSEPGDLILMDFLTLHSSGKNVSNRSRWSMQFRYFNFNHPSGININWIGGVASGVQIKQIHPELIIEN